MGAAALTSNIHQLIHYEPGLGLTYPPGSIQAIEEALAADDREAAIFAAFGALDLTEPTPRSELWKDTATSRSRTILRWWPRSAGSSRRVRPQRGPRCC